MNKRVIFFTVLLIYVVTVSSFANGDHEKSDSEKNVQEKVAEPAFTGTIPVDEAKIKDEKGLVSQFKDKIVGIEAAGAAAVKAHPDSALNGITLDIENGYLVYDVFMDDGTSMVIDAGTGKILHEEKHNSRESNEDGKEEKEEEKGGDESSTESD